MKKAKHYRDGKSLFSTTHPTLNPAALENCEIEIKALATQVGGTHYKDMTIQPVQYIHANGLNFLAGNVVKYISRYNAKGGRADVEKAIHYCELLLQLEYGNDAEGADTTSFSAPVKEEGTALHYDTATIMKDLTDGLTKVRNKKRSLAMKRAWARRKAAAKNGKIKDLARKVLSIDTKPKAKKTKRK